MTQARTVGDLKKLLEEYPDDMVIGGYSDKSTQDYQSVSVYVHDRTDDADWQADKTDEALSAWWQEVPPPDVVLVFAVG